MESGPQHVTKDDLVELKEDLRTEIASKLEAINWKILAIGGINLAGLIGGFSPGAASTAASTAHSIGKAVGLV